MMLVSSFITPFGQYAVTQESADTFKLALWTSRSSYLDLAEEQGIDECTKVMREDMQERIFAVEWFKKESAEFLSGV